VGLARYREGLYPLTSFTKEDAIEVLNLIHSWQEKLFKEYGTHFIHAGDEWYLLAEQELPVEETYDGYLQLENGVGMVRLLENEVLEELSQMQGDDTERRISIATGILAAPLLQQLTEKISEKYPRVQVRVFPVTNEFFGERITVAGLLTGQDLKEQLTGQELGTELLLTEHMLRDGEEVFLDDMSVSELSGALQVPITIVKSDGKAFLEAVLGKQRLMEDLR